MAVGPMEALLEGTVLAVAALPAGRVLLTAPIRRELRAHPLLATILVGGAALALTLIAWAAFRSDPFRRVVVALAGLGALLALLRARPGYGRSRGLPPGSLGLATSLDAIDDPGFYAKAADRWGPIFKMSQIHRPVVCITDLPLGLEFLRTEDDALVQSNWSFNRLVPGGYLEYMNGDVHARYRRIFAAAFTQEALQDSEESITVVVRRQLAEMARSGSGSGVDPEPLLLPIALTSLLRVVLGVNADSERFVALRSLFTELNRPLELFLPTPKVKLETYRALTATIAKLAESARRASPTTPGARSVLAHLLESDPTQLDDETVAGNVILMVKEGSIMVRGLLRWLLKMLAEDPRWTEQFRSVAADPARVDALVTNFVYETIRLYESRYVYRSVSRDVRLGPYRVPKGWLVRLCLGEAHERLENFPEPSKFDPGRFAKGNPDSATFCPFGEGRHACLGADVAVAIAKTFVREAALGYDLRTTGGGAAWRINRHWGLWRPSQQLRIVVSPRTRPANSHRELTQST